MKTILIMLLSIFVLFVSNSYAQCPPGYSIGDPVITAQISNDCYAIVRWCYKLTPRPHAPHTFMIEIYLGDIDYVSLNGAIDCTSPITTAVFKDSVLPRILKRVMTIQNMAIPPCPSEETVLRFSPGDCRTDLFKVSEYNAEFNSPFIHRSFRCNNQITCVYWYTACISTGPHNPDNLPTLTLFLSSGSNAQCGTHSYVIPFEQTEITLPCKAMCDQP